MKLSQLINLGEKLSANHPEQALKVFAAALSLEQFIFKLPTRSQQQQIDRIKSKYPGEVPQVAKAEMEMLEWQARKDAFTDFMNRVDPSKFDLNQKGFLKRVKAELDRQFFDAASRFNQHKTLLRYVKPRGDLIPSKKEEKKPEEKKEENLYAWYKANVEKK